MGESQQSHHLKSGDFVKSLNQFFQRDLISLPLVKRANINKISQQCQLKASLLEFDISGFPNIDYIAGNRLNIYATNSTDHVNTAMKHIIDDIYIDESKPLNKFKKFKFSDPWARFVQLNGKNSIRLALTYVYDIRSPPSRELLRIMADCCTKKEHKAKLIALSKTDENWEAWVCQTLRTLKSVFDEYNSCMISAKTLFSELTLQQPRQYSLSSIKSSKRFRAEILVIQHKFTSNQIKATMQVLKERDLAENSAGVQEHQRQLPGQIHQRKEEPPNRVKSPTRSYATTAMVHDEGGQQTTRSTASIRSIRSIGTFGTSPIASQQVNHVPSFSGPLMSLYASSTSGLTGTDSGQAHQRSKELSTVHRELDGAVPSGRQFDGLCSNYLITLNPSDLILCEFVENPRFTLKGNRERPVILIGQDIGLVAFRSFWQQRALEHDRAQMFYSLFRDLSPKKFGEMHLVCLTGGRCKIEELLKKEVYSVITHKILTSASNVQRRHLIALLDNTATLSEQGRTNVSSGINDNNGTSQTKSTTSQSDERSLRRTSNHRLSSKSLKTSPNLPSVHLSMSKELSDLGAKMAKLLIEDNGCIYTCCDPHMTQALEILVVEGVVRNYGRTLTRQKIMSLLPKWKGKKSYNDDKSTFSENGNNTDQKNFLFKLENQFENAQIVQEIYDSSI